MAASHLVSGGEFAPLGDRNPHHCIHTGSQIGAVVTSENFDIHHFSTLAMRHTQRGIAHITGFFTEDGAQQTLLRGEFLLTFGGDFSNQDVIGTDLCTDADDPVLVEVLDGHLADVGDVTRNFFGSQAGIAGLDLEFFNVDGGVAVLLDQSLRNDNRILEVGTLPGDKRHRDVLPQGQFSAHGRG